MPKILHITDLHIENPNLGILRDDFYDEYIDALFDAFQNLENSDITHLFITGDFINKYEVKSFSHAKKIISYIIKKFKINEDNVILSIGNHDFDRELDINKSDFKKARAKYASFRNEITLKKLAADSEYFQLFEFEEFYCLTLDSTYRTKQENIPGFLEDSEINSIIAAVKSVKQQKPLCILSHFPFIDYPGRPDSYEEHDWHKKHFWSSGVPIYKRLSNIFKDTQIYIFNGDIHHSDHFQFDNLVLVSCGSFGKSSNNQFKQAKLVSISQTSAEVITYNWLTPSHKDTEQYGEWEAFKSSIRQMNFEKKTSNKQISVKLNPNKNTILLNKQTEKDIEQAVSFDDIYHFGRFSSISKEKISLGWIDINSLMNYDNLLSKIPIDIANYIKINLPDLNESNSVLLGIDSWGNAIGSEVSVMVGIPNLCLPSRGLNDDYSDDELLCEESLSIIQNASNIIYICDVVATGNTANEFFRVLNQQTSLLAKNIFIYSIIESGDNEYELAFIKLHLVSCNSVVIPIIEKSRLPKEEILPYDVLFRKK